MKFKCTCGTWLTIDQIIVNRTFCECPICNKGWHIYPDMIKQTHCYNPQCNRNLIYRIGLEDAKYGHYCSNCDNSLRHHPFFGEGMEFDMADSAKWYKWNQLNKHEKYEVFKRYGF